MAKYPSLICLKVIPDFKVGDPIPSGYVERAEWARVQLRGGLRPARRACGKLHFPQELCGEECGGHNG